MDVTHRHASRALRGDRLDICATVCGRDCGGLNVIYSGDPAPATCPECVAGESEARRTGRLR